MPLRDIAVAIALVAFAAGGVQAQTAMPMDHATHHTGMSAAPSGAVPTMPGQDAFGTVQEIVRILAACRTGVLSQAFWQTVTGLAETPDRSILLRCPSGHIE